MAIPLFKFPILVIKLVLETMGFIEIFVLTSTSSKTKRIFKNLVTIRNHRMILFMKKGNIAFDFRSDSDPSFDAPIYMNFENRSPKDKFGLEIGINNLASKLFETESGTFILQIYCKNTVYRRTELYNALMEVFRIPVKAITMNVKDISSRNCRSWINWNNDYFLDTPLLDIVGLCSFHNYIRILENVRTQNKLFLRVEPTDYPEDFENIEILNVEVTTIIIDYGKWVGLQQLKAFKAQTIIVNCASLADAEINSFLRDWRNSEVASNLRELKIRFHREADPEVVLEGLDATDEILMKPNDALNQWSFTMTNGETCTVIYAFYSDEEHGEEFGFEFQVGK